MAGILTPLTLGRYGGVYGEFGDVEPFSIRSGYSYEGILSDIRTWIRDDLVPFLTENNAQSTWDANAASLVSEVNTALDDAVQQVITGSIPVSSELMWTVLQTQGVFVAEHFGAVGDGVADDRAAVQAAIDAASALYKIDGKMRKVWLSRRYAMSGVDYYLDSGQPQGACCIVLKSGVILDGDGTLFPRTGAYGPGAYFRTVCSPSTGLVDAEIRNISFTGNLSKFADSTGCANIDLFVARNFTVRNTRHIDANGCAIRIVGNKAQNVKVLHNTILACHNVGIQASGFDGLIIADNYVVNTRDNGIDIYGEMGAGVDSNGINFDIHDNYIANCPTGICPETVAMGRVHDNIIVNCTNVGIQMNRINSLPHTVDISDNTILFCARGVAVVGGMQDIRVTRNMVRGSSVACVQLGWGGDCAGVLCAENTLNGADGSVPRVLITGATASDIDVRNNRSRYSDGYTDVVNNANNSVRVNTQSNNFPKNGKIEVATGQSFQLYLPPNTAGRLVMQASSGGGFQSIWEGIWTSSATVAYLKETGRTFIDSGHDLFGAVQVLAGTMNAGIQFPQTGSTIAVRWMMEYL